MRSHRLLISLLSGLRIRLLIILRRIRLLHLLRVLLLVILVGLILARSIGVLRGHILVVAIIHAAPFHAREQNSGEGAHDEEELEDGLHAGEVVWLDVDFERVADVDDGKGEV